jgi:hypothetical protein
MDIQIETAAHRLAIAFADDTDIPARFRKERSKNVRNKKSSNDSLIENRFKMDVNHWKNLILTMLKKLDDDIAWRFVNISPNVETKVDSAAYNDDFCLFIDYLVLRRDKEKCDSEELGRLAMLSGAFQKEIEKQLKSLK